MHRRVKETLDEAKMSTFTLETTHFIFNKCPIYTHDGASAKFSTNLQETDYSVLLLEVCQLFLATLLLLTPSLPLLLLVRDVPGKSILLLFIISYFIT